MSYCTRAALLLLMLQFPLAYAEEGQRFYPVVDADGRIRVINAPAEKKSTKKGDKNVAPVESLAAPAEGLASDDQAPFEPLRTPVYAPYGSDIYLDSDVLESSAFSPEKKKNFYIIPDGSGTRIEQSEISRSDFFAGSEKPSSIDQVTIDLPDELVQVRGTEALRDLLGAAFCLSSSDIKQALNFVGKQWRQVYIDKQAVSFSGSKGVLAVYRVDGDGMRVVKVRSYASSIKSPTFAMPYVALAGADGCVDRAVSSYFQKQYLATKSQHAMLEAEITMHAEERFLLVIVSDIKSQRGSEAYQLSKYGQIGIKW